MAKKVRGAQFCSLKETERRRISPFGCAKNTYKLCIQNGVVQDSLLDCKNICYKCDGTQLVIFSKSDNDDDTDNKNNSNNTGKTNTLNTENKKTDAHTEGNDEITFQPNKAEEENIPPTDINEANSAPIESNGNQISGYSNNNNVNSNGAINGRTSAFSNNPNSSINKFLNGTGLPNGVIYGIGAGMIILLILITILIINCFRKRKNGDNRKSKDRNITDSQGYDQLNDDNYSSYRTLTNSSLHASSSVVEVNPYIKTSSVDELPTIDNILIESKKNNNSQNSLNTSLIYGNENSLVIKNPNHSFNDLNGDFHKVNTSLAIESPADVSFHKNASMNYEGGILDNSFSKRPISKMGSKELSYSSPREAPQTQKNSVIQPMSATVTTAEALFSSKAVNSPSESWSQDKNKNITNTNSYLGGNRVSSNVSLNNVDENTISSLSETKQTYSNLPYSPTAMANTSTSQKYYRNNTNSVQASPMTPVNVASPNSNNHYVITNQNLNQNSVMNPFSDSHVAASPTTGYAPELTINTSILNNNQEPKQNFKDISSDNENISQNQSFANMNKNHSFKNDESFMNSPITPKSISSLISPMNKHQSYVTSPTGVNRKSIRTTLTSPIHENFMNVGQISVDPKHSSNLRTSSISNQRSMSGTPNLSMNDSRNNIKPGSIQSPNGIRPSTPKTPNGNGYTSNLEHKSSGRSVRSSTTGTPNMSQHSNAGTPSLEHKASSKSQHSFISGSTPVLDNISSSRQTIDRHHSSKSLKTSPYNTATLERVPSGGQLHQHSLSNIRRSESSPSDVKGETSTLSNSNLMVMSPTQVGKSPQSQPKSILKNSNSISHNNSLSSSGKLAPQDDLVIAHSHSMKKMKSKSRKTTPSIDNVGGTVVSTSSGDLNIPPFPSMSRKTSGALRGDGSNSSTYAENLPTTPLRPPQLTVFGHAVATPPTPKSTRFPQDAKVLPPTERVTPVPPDILGGTDVVPLNTMTLQRKHFHKRNKSVTATNTVNEYNDFDVDGNNIKSKTSGDHPLPVPPPHHQNSKSNGDIIAANIHANGSLLEKERVGRGRDQSSESYHYRSKSLPRPNKYNNNSRLIDDHGLISSSSLTNSTILHNLEQKLTNFEVDFYKENETQKMIKSRSKNSVISILHEEKRNMDYYIAHCDD